MSFLMDFMVTLIEYVVYFLFGLALLCVLGVVGVLMLMTTGATWATADWLVFLRHCALMGRKPPSWYSRFMGLDGRSMDGL
ncbi:hypothetical protein KZX46_10515 [Polymorphobacter sp. PAMC 29334]|uniref:hypothetical protein n=1 Tax=Polymorphobacter sp. PAMC 29334 TaxID=2862331 RepID=UPI001C7563C8|nr:hypothetical protein [Polymorphobacter sp. PAMC 29334]QYE36316.1 hypothetical protein KZX46_10515 [Polymorphobacter sp. PAMC 29334]